MNRLMLMLEVVGLSLPKPLILFFKFIDVQFCSSFFTFCVVAHGTKTPQKEITTLLLDDDATDVGTVAEDGGAAREEMPGLDVSVVSSSPNHEVSIHTYLEDFYVVSCLGVYVFSQMYDLKAIVMGLNFKMSLYSLICQTQNFTPFLWGCPMWILSILLIMTSFEIVAEKASMCNFR